MPEWRNGTLSASACKIALALIKTGRSLRTSELAEVAGVRYRMSWYAAAAELEAAGLVEVTRLPGREMILSPLPFLLYVPYVNGATSEARRSEAEGRPSDSEADLTRQDDLYLSDRGRGFAGTCTVEPDNPVGSNHAPPARSNHTGMVEPDRSNHAGQTTQVEPDRSNHTGTVEPHSPSFDDELLYACEDADAMPNDGKWETPASNVRMRRKRQLELVNQMWPMRFPDKTLTEDNAKQLLVLSGDRTALIYEVIKRSEGRKVDYPLAYTSKGIKDEVAKLGTSSAHSSSAKDVIGDDEMHDPTPEWLARQAAVKERYLKMLEEDERARSGH